MAEPALSDFTELAALWAVVSRRSRAREQAEPMIFNQMAVALAGRLPQASAPALQELHALAEAIGARGLATRPAPITGLRAGERIALSADSFQRLAAACLAAL